MIEGNIQLLDSFERLRFDKKLEGVMDSENPCQLQLWFLEVHHDEQTSQRLLYSWVIPGTIKSGKWYMSDVMKKWSPNTKEYRANILKLTYYNSGKIIAAVMAELLKGYTLIEACETLDLEKPPEKIEMFVLDNLEMKKGYIVRPPIFLETESIINLYQDFVQPIQSPSHYASAISGSLFCLQKLRIWENSDVLGQPLDNVDVLSKLCIIELNKETGLSFGGRDSSRLGNVEWIDFPLANFEESPIDFNTVKEEVAPGKGRMEIREISCKDVEVFLASGIELPSESLLIRCRLRNGNEVIRDQTKLVDGKEALRGVRFSSNQEINRVQLTVWLAKGKEMEWDIWTETDTPLMKIVGMAMGLTGLQEKVKLSTLSSLENSVQVKNRVQKYEEIKQTSYQHSNIGPFTLELWKNSKKEVQSYVKRLFPPESGAKFFPKGWADNEPGVLGFAEWFQSLSSSTDNTSITIVDPYFDTVGIEMIAHTNTTNTSFDILTCTQTKSNDDEIIEVLERNEHTGTVEPNRATRIKEACTQLNPVLSRLQLSVLDIRSKGNGRKSSYLHDRYILVYDSNGLVSEGFNLSNSIQAATKLHPLLITLIPSDILESVAAYVEELKNVRPPTINNATAIQIYTTKKPVHDTSRKGDKKNKHISNTKVFFAVLLEEAELSFEEDLAIEKKLITKGLLSTNGSSFKIEKEEEMMQNLDKYSERLVKKDAELFNTQWEQFSYWLANVLDSEEYLYQLCENPNKKIIEQLKLYLLNLGDSKFQGLGRTQDREIHIYINVLNSGYKEGLYDAYNFLNKVYDVYLFGYFEIAYAIQAILKIEPTLLIEILEELYKKVEPKKHMNKDFITSAFILDKLILELTFRSNGEVIDRLLVSTIPFLRALGSQAKYFCWDLLEESEMGKTNILTELNETERLFAYSEWVYHLRIESNRNGVETTELSSKRLGIFRLLRMNWHSQLYSAQVNQIISRLCGPLVGSWAKDIYHEFMSGLVSDDKLDSDDAILFWIEILLGKIDGDETGNVSFYGPTDCELTELCSTILSDLSAKSWRKLKVDIQSKINKLNREIRQPFEKSKNFRKWNNTLQSGLWLMTFLKLASEISSEINPEIDLLLERMDKDLKVTKECTNGQLLIFANNI